MARVSCEPARSSGPVAFGFLAKLTADEVTALRASGRVRTYRRGAALFFEGERSQTVAIVLRGRGKVSSLSSDGHETVLAFRSPGDLLGELSVLDGGPRSASVTAAEPVVALIVSGSRFRELLAARPRIAIVLLETLTRRLRVPTGSGSSTARTTPWGASRVGWWSSQWTTASMKPPVCGSHCRSRRVSSRAGPVRRASPSPGRWPSCAATASSARIAGASS